MSYLCGHDPLSLGDQSALGADTVPPPAVPLVSLECRHHAVVPTARTLRSALVPLRGPKEKRGRNCSQHGVLRHQSRNVHTARQTHAAGKSSSHTCCVVERCAELLLEGTLSSCVEYTYRLQLRTALFIQREKYFFYLTNEPL